MDPEFNIEENNVKEKTIVEFILYYFHILINYKLSIIIITSTLTALAAVLLLISALLPPEKSPLPNTYRASIILYVQSEGSNGLEAFFSSTFRDSPLESYFSGIDIGELAISLIHSGRFLDILIEELEIEKKMDVENAKKIEYRRFLLSLMQTTYDRGRSILVIHCEDIDPVFTAKLANSIAEHLINWFSEEGGTKKANMKNLVEEKIIAVTEEISKLETKIRRFQKKYGILTPSELASIHADLLRDLNSQLVLKELEIKNHEELVKVEDRTSRRLKVEKNNILELIDQIEKGNTTSGRQIPPRDEVPDLLLEFNQLELNLEIQRTIYETLFQQYEILKLSAGVDSIFQVLEWAEIPEEKSGPSRIQLLIIVAGLAFLGSLGIALLRNYIKKMKNPKRPVLEEF